MFPNSVLHTLKKTTCTNTVYRHFSPIYLIVLIFQPAVIPVSALLFIFYFLASLPLSHAIPHVATRYPQNFPPFPVTWTSPPTYRPVSDFLITSSTSTCSLPKSLIMLHQPQSSSLCSCLCLGLSPASFGLSIWCIVPSCLLSHKFFSDDVCCIHVHLGIWQTLLSKATYELQFQTKWTAQGLRWESNH